MSQDFVPETYPRKDQGRVLRNAFEDVGADMQSVADTAETEGIYMDEYETDFGLPMDMKPRCQLAMDRWDAAVDDLQQAVREILALGAELREREEGASHG